MGNGMNKVMPGLYVGNYRDSKDYQQLDRFQITHIVSIHDSPRRFHPDKHYLCVMAADTPDQNLSQYFSVCNDFIHSARLKDGNVLIHCLAGMSRSVTVAVAYIMTVTPLDWKEALKVVRAGRAIANPNLGFQNQLQEFESCKLLEERKRLKERFPSLALETVDREQCTLALDHYETLLENNGVCEGQCKFGKDCPTGICRSESRGLRRKASMTSQTKKQYNNNLSPSPSTSSQLSVRSVGVGMAQSCPTSPRCSKGPSSLQKVTDNPRAAGDYAAEIDIGELSELRRSSSIVSTFRPRSSPAGLYSYTGSAPPSIHGSRVDLSNSAIKNSGSAIYLGNNSPTGSPTHALNRRISLTRSNSKSTPKSTPESSPKPSPKKSAPKSQQPPNSGATVGGGGKSTNTSSNNSSKPNGSPSKGGGGGQVASSKSTPKPPVTPSKKNLTTSKAVQSTAEPSLPSRSSTSSPMPSKSLEKSNKPGVKHK
ncbi:mucin-1 [Uranotaenia lowii]|uniref:mucin-1 n=1 Tax=Uranotaenia lowii TaxID=190385 RepID=UPI00247A5BE9|nr:mucin-1 [Uranotaenia lowii]